MSNPLKKIDKSKLPYSLLLDPVTGQAAAYTNTHRLITYQASAELVAYAQAHPSKTAAFDAKSHAYGAPVYRPLPQWATPEVLDRALIVWIKRPTGDDPPEHWLAIPPV